MLLPSNIRFKTSFAPINTLCVLPPLFYHLNTAIYVPLTAGSFVEAGEAAIGAKPNLYCEAAAFVALPRSDPTTDDLKSRVEFAGGTTVIRVK